MASTRTTEVFRLRFYDCSHEARWMSGDEETRAPEFHCEVRAATIDEADDLAREEYDIPTSLCCCEPLMEVNPK